LESLKLVLDQTKLVLLMLAKQHSMNLKKSPSSKRLLEVSLNLMKKAANFVLKCLEDFARSVLPTCTARGVFSTITTVECPKLFESYLLERKNRKNSCFLKSFERFKNNLYLAAVCLFVEMAWYEATIGYLKQNFSRQKFENLRRCGLFFNNKNLNK
jgi:hypothetical protein